MPRKPYDPDVLVDKIAEYAGTINSTLQAVAQAIKDEHYGTAMSLMQDLTQIQANTSLTMRSTLIKAGLIGSEDDDDN